MQHNTGVCPYCCQWLHPDNHHVRLRPKQRPSARVQSVLLRKARGKRLSLVQKNLLCRFQKSSSVLVRRQTNNKSKHLIMCFTALQHIVQEYNGSDNSKPRQHKVLYIKHAGPKEHKRKAHMYLQRIKNKMAPNTRVNITDESSAVRDIKKSLQKRKQRMANMDLKEQSTPLVMSGSLFWLYDACFSVLSLYSV